MAIWDNNGTTTYEIGKMWDNNGTTTYQIDKVYDNNGTTNTLVFEDDPYTYRERVFTKSTSGSDPYLTWQSMNKTTVTETEDMKWSRTYDKTLVAVNYDSQHWHIQARKKLLYASSYDMSGATSLASGAKLDIKYNTTFDYYFVEA